MVGLIKIVAIIIMLDLFFKKNFMAPFFGWGSTISRQQSDY